MGRSFPNKIYIALVLYSDNMLLYVVRHGQTIENLKGIIQGHLPGHLSKEGKQQAKKIAKRLKQESFDAIYVSDLARAVDTAKEIVRFHKKTKVIITKGLREVDMGPYSGKFSKDFKIPIGGPATELKGVETRVNLVKRAKKLINEVYKTYPSGKVLFVTHGSFGRAIHGAIMGIKPNEIHKIERPNNTAVSVFEIREDKKNKIHLMNCDEHLKA